MKTVIELQRNVVKALEQGKDTAPILKELAELRAKQAMDGELVELTKVANQKQALRDTAKGIKDKVEKQNTAIDEFLSARDTLVKQLQPLLESMAKLAKMGAAGWEKEPGEMWTFNDMSVFSAAVRSVPSSYLPSDFGCPWLRMADGATDSRGMANEANQYLNYALAILKGFQKGVSQIGSSKADNPLIENVDIAGGCSICSHPEVAEIDKALRDNISLRTIEAKHKVSRSSLSRHRNNCLNLGIVRMAD